MKKFLKSVFPFLPAALYYGLIFYVSSRNVEFPLSLPGRHADKALHILEFAVLGWLLAFGFSRIKSLSPRNRAAAVLLTGAVLGILDEVHQSFVPGRHPDLWDIAADIVGIAFGYWVYRIPARFSRKPS
ncbi:MAG: VanZ family protein [Acidobacteriota bacterium]|nr:VanZ family protein [Acidobacteriota bacterium]